MRKLIPMLPLLAALAFAGCATTDGEQNVLAQIKTASFVGTWLALREEPGHRDEFKAVHNQLATLEKAEVIDFPTVLAVLLMLPVDELRSDEAVLIITASTILLQGYAGSIDLANAEKIRPIITALREGIELGMTVSPEEFSTTRRAL